MLKYPKGRLMAKREVAAATKAVNTAALAHVLEFGLLGLVIAPPPGRPAARILLNEIMNAHWKLIARTYKFQPIYRRAAEELCACRP
jgi:hypothetical protein